MPRKIKISTCWHRQPLLCKCRLKYEVALLRKALEPFARFSEAATSFNDKGDLIYSLHGNITAELRKSDCDFAQSVLDEVRK